MSSGGAARSTSASASRTIAMSYGVIVAFATCQAQPSASPSPSAASTSSNPGIVAGDVVQIHAASGSTVTVRVREQLARLPAPSDAVLTTSGVKGDLFMHPDGSFANGSQIVVDLTSL